MLPWLFWSGPSRLGGVGWKKGATLAFFAGPLFVTLGVGGFAYAPLSYGAVVMPATVALASIIFEGLFLSEVLTRQHLIGAIVIFTGVSLIAFGQGGVPSPSAWIGDLLFVAAGMF